MTTARPVPLDEVGGRRRRLAVLHARQVAIHQEEGPPASRHTITAEDLARTQFRIRTGYPPPDMLGGVWRY
jgi:hypothetical protein